MPPLVATPPSAVREVELMSGEGRVGRVEGDLETLVEAMGAQIEPVTDTLVDREGVWPVRAACRAVCS